LPRPIRQARNDKHWIPAFAGMTILRPKRQCYAGQALRCPSGYGGQASRVKRGDKYLCGEYDFFEVFSEFG